MLRSDGSVIIDLNREDQERLERTVALLRDFIIEKRDLQLTYEQELGIKSSKNAFKRYCYLLYEMMLFFKNKPDAQGAVLTDQEALHAVNQLFSVAAATNQGYCSKEYLDFMKAVAVSISNETVLNDTGGQYRERLKQIVIIEANRLVNESIQPTEILSDEERVRKVRLQAQRILYKIGQKTIQKVDDRFFAGIIALNGFMTLVAFGIFAKLERNKYIFNHPAILYVIGAVLYADIFTQVITKGLQAVDNLAKSAGIELAVPIGLNRAYISLISVAAAIIGKTWADNDPDLEDKTWKAIVPYVVITGIAALEVISPLYTSLKVGRLKIPGLFTKTDWFLDSVPYQRKPTAPGRIFIAAALPAIMKGINSISDMAGWPFFKQNHGFFTTWILTAAITQVAQLIYFCTILPSYASSTEKNQGLQKYDPLFFLQYGYEKNKFVNSRQAENIWGIWGVIYVSTILANVQGIYPDQKWISLMNAFLVLLIGPRLGALFQHHVFCLSEVDRSVSYKYLKYIDRVNSQHPQVFNPVQYPDRLELSTIIANRGLINRESNWWILRKLFGGPQTLHEKIQQVESTSQTGTRLLPFGLRNQAASISNVALYLVILFYFWNELANPLLDKNSNVGKGTWATTGIHLAISTLVVFGVRLFQWLIASAPSIVEKTLIESTAPVTRTVTFAKDVVKGLCQRKPPVETIIESAKKNVYIKPKEQYKRYIDDMVGNLPPAESPVDTVASQRQVQTIIPIVYSARQSSSTAPVYYSTHQQPSPYPNPPIEMMLYRPEPIRPPTG